MSDARAPMPAPYELDDVAAALQRAIAPAADTSVLALARTA